MKLKILLLTGIFNASIIIWPIPPTIPLESSDEQLVIKDNCPLAQEPFADIIIRQHARNKPFILGRVTTQVNGKDTVHYFDMYLLNKWVFNERLYGQTLKRTNPFNRQPIIDLQYFSLEPQSTQLRFLGSYKQFIDPNFKKHFNNYPSGPQDDLDTARAYFHGKQNFKQDYARALFFYKLVARQKDDPSLRAKAQLKLFTLYMNGLGAKSNPSRAMRYAKRAAKQTLNLQIKARAELELGKEYFSGNNVDQNYENARQHFQYAFDQIFNAYIRASAAYYLGQLFANHYNNIPLATLLYKHASGQNDNREAKARSDLALVELSIMNRKAFAALHHFFALIPNIGHADIKNHTLQHLHNAPTPRKLLRELFEEKFTTWEDL